VQLQRQKNELVATLALLREQHARVCDGAKAGVAIQAPAPTPTPRESSLPATAAAASAEEAEASAHPTEAQSPLDEHAAESLALTALPPLPGREARGKPRG
jgi:hypothetical protein